VNNQFIKIRLEAGTHYVCACGRTSNLPFCDGSHQETTIQPLVLELDCLKDIEILGLPKG